MHRSLADVNLAAIERNCARLCKRTPLLCAVVKADGYGHGAVPVARAALGGGAQWLAVATASEAQELRESSVQCPLLVLGALTRSELELALSVEADVVAWSSELVGAVGALGGGRVHVKLDTGMGRLGERDAAAALRVVDAVIEQPGVELVGAMTHFATADDLADTFFGEQLARFAAWLGDVRLRAPGVIAHAANSAALLRDEAAAFDMARCGIAVYGLDPYGVDARAHGLEPALELRSWVSAVKRLHAGETAGYGRRFTAREATWLGVIPLGYGDGYRRAFSNNADVLIAGRRIPVVGTVSMDNVTVDLGPHGDVEVGEPVTLIGADGAERILVEEMAVGIGTINYEITCGLGARVPRRYHRDGVVAAT